jgi:cerevisin
MKLLTTLSLVSLVSARTIFNLWQGPDDVPIVTAANAQAIPGSYIVKFKDHVKHADAAAHHSWLNDLHLSHENRKLELRKRSQFPVIDLAFEGLKHTYNIAGNFMGYSGHFDDAVIEQLRRHPDVSRSHTDMNPTDKDRLSTLNKIPRSTP